MKNPSMYTHSFVNTETQQFIIGLDFYTRACLDFWIEKVREKKKQHTIIYLFAYANEFML